MRSRWTRLLGSEQLARQQIARARRVYSTLTKYGCAPIIRSRASSSVFGPSAASTTGTG